MEGPGSDVKSSWGPAVAWALLCPPHMDGPHTAPCAASSLAPLELTPCPPLVTAGQQPHLRFADPALPSRPLRCPL